MKIQIHYVPQAEEVFVWGLVGQKTIEQALTRLNDEIKNINNNLRKLYE